MKFFSTLALLLAAPALLVVDAQKTSQLYVKLDKAMSLHDKGWIGKSDPYIEIWLDKSYKARPKDTKGHNPVFNQTFCFWVRSGQTQLNVRAVDKDTLSDDKIGETKIVLNPLFRSSSILAKDYNLPKWLGLRSNGNVNLEVKFVPGV